MSHGRVDDGAGRAAGARFDYDGDGLAEGHLLETPFAQARRWVDEAVARSQVEKDVFEPLAVSVATVDAAGVPNVRTVLMRFLDERGPGFVTALTSAKGLEIAANPVMAVALTWPAMYRAIRFRGRAAMVDRSEVLDYWHSRPWASRISAWTSHQSEPVGSRADLEAAYARRAAQFPDTGSEADVPVPDFWGGYRVVPDEVEFWAGRRNRLHDRLVFTRVGDGDLGDAASWQVHRRQP
jgi:pyridoxamine 5'-phosphate oxidase